MALREVEEGKECAVGRCSSCDAAATSASHRACVPVALQVFGCLGFELLRVFAAQYHDALQDS
jgi:hypothetical protein